MNLVHRWLCGSAAWHHHVGTRLLPWGLEGIELGGSVLELGAGPGAATRALLPRTRRVTAVEIDERMARRLAAPASGGAIGAVRADAAVLPFQDGVFDAAVAFTMLHHVRGVRARDRVLREAVRVLRPGGVLAGTDALDGVAFRVLHARSGLTAVDPDEVGRQLGAAGLIGIRVDTGPGAFRFRGTRPDTLPPTSPAPAATR